MIGSSPEINNHAPFISRWVLQVRADIYDHVSPPVSVDSIVLRDGQTVEGAIARQRRKYLNEPLPYHFTVEEALTALHGAQAASLAINRQVANAVQLAAEPTAETMPIAVSALAARGAANRTAA